MTLVIAHRGASAAEPENTVAAFRRAGEMGAEGVELDVRRTADDRLVVHHDAALADGRVIRMIRTDDLPGSVPSLDDALDACAGLFVNIEIKNDPDEPDGDTTHWSAHAVAALLARRGTPRRWLVSSFRAGTVGRMRRIAPSSRTALLCTELGEAQIAHAVAVGHEAVHPWVGSLTVEAVRSAHVAGLAVNGWTCDEPDRIAELVAWGVDGICTNVPDVALAVRGSTSAPGTGSS